MAPFPRSRIYLDASRVWLGRPPVLLAKISRVVPGVSPYRDRQRGRMRPLHVFRLDTLSALVFFILPSLWQGQRTVRDPGILAKSPEGPGSALKPEL